MKHSTRTIPTLLFILALGMLSFTPPEGGNITDRVIRFFDTLDAVPQSKLYLHLDKPYYKATDSIWFKAYLVNATNHKLNMQDNFVYVELLDPKDSILLRRKYKRSDEIFAGAIPLPEKISSGEYLLRAYTNWMRNTDEAFFYTRKVRIFDPKDIRTRSAVEYITTAKGDVEARIRFISDLGLSFNKTNVAYGLYDGNGKKIREKILTCNENDEINIPFRKSEVSPGAYIRVDFAFTMDKYGRNFFLPDFSDEFDISFFPEGGNLLAGMEQNVAFKCQQADGYGKDISGVITNSQGDTLTTFGTEHDGMGSFRITPVAGEEYTARPDKSDRTFALPRAEEKGFALALTQEGNKLEYRILSTPETVWPDTLLLLGHTRGIPLVLTRLEEKDRSGIINIHTFGDGISHLLLLDKNGSPLSRRLLFKYPEKLDFWSVQTDKGKYDAREKVSMEIDLALPDDAPEKGSFSVSITDNNSVIPDSTANHIVSYLLLTSDLKGYIDNPRFYFLGKNPARLKALDLLMLTHGWSRFPVDNFKQSPVKKPEFLIEREQYLSGNIENFFGKKAKEAQVFAMAPQHNLMCSFQADEKGKFLIDGMVYPDTTLFIFLARTRKGSSFASVEIDKETFPEKDIHIPFRHEGLSLFSDDSQSIPDSYFSANDSLRITQLKEVTIIGKESDKPEYTASSSEIQKTKYRYIADLARVMLDKVIRDNPRPTSESGLLVLIDNRRFSTGRETLPYGGDMGPESPTNNIFGILNIIRTEEVESIEIYRDQNQTDFPFGSGVYPAVSVRLKPEARKLITRPNMAWNESLGYTPRAEFYHPVYSAPKKATDDPDDRTTLYWNPDLKFDKEGKATVEFYTSDNPSSYNIEIEGISSKGIPCRFLGKTGNTASSAD